MKKFSIYIQELYKSYSYSFSLFYLFLRFLTSHKTRKLNEETNGERFCKEFLLSLLIFLCLKKNILKKIPKIMQIHMYMYIPTVRACVCVCLCRCMCGNEDAKKHAEFWRRAVPHNNKRFKQIAKSVCVCV